MTSSACTSPLDIQVTGLHCLESFLSGPARPLGREAARSAPPALRTLCPVWQRRLVFVRVPFSSLQVSLAGLSPPPATRGTFCPAGSTSPPRLCQVDEFLNASMQLWEGGRVRERVGAALVGVGGFGWAEEERRWGGRETERQREGKREGEQVGRRLKGRGTETGLFNSSIRSGTA